MEHARIDPNLLVRFQLVASLGLVVFQALDFGLSETEEQKLSAPLEGLIARMTGAGGDAEDAEEDGDEGIGEDTAASERCSLAEVLQVGGARNQGGCGFPSSNRVLMLKVESV